LCLIKYSILDDRKKINNATNTIQTQNSEIRSQLLFNEVLIKLKFLENKVDQIIENIYSAKHYIFHPSILTSEEIDKYNIDFYKLSLMKMGVLLYNNNCLIFSIKIPINYSKHIVKIIVPIPNQKNKITFNDIVLINTKNIEKNEELKQHQNISYSLILVVFVVM
ncbi:uncharacterized protein LOC133321901, partial [Musca vetustissima]|uniref:uncharacterized protein LOC133321901 n=1 Tax=Musca vetustissima TaxID=27455 RepID=UPI002AB661CE